MDKTEKEIVKERNQIAGEALSAAKDRIVAGMRFLDPAIFALADSPEESTELIFATDGKSLHYSANYVIACCSVGLRELTHNYLHVLLHCIFRHHSVSPSVNRQCWNLAADVAAEALIQSFQLDGFESARAIEREKYIQKFRAAAGGVSAERLYRYFRSPNIKDSDLEEIEKLFLVDSHAMWYPGEPHRMMPDAENREDDSSSSSADDSDSNSENSRKDADEQSNPDIPDWDAIAQMVKISLEAEQSGTDDRDILTALNARTERTIDYSTFLRKFAVRRENLKVDDNEFDYIYYTYGLEIYGDMPLVEPLEYSDEKSIRDLVIVIDTSASTEGELVESFIQRTFDMLEGSKEFQNRFNIHLIQCDSKVQTDQIMRSKEDIRTFMENFELRGFGGTDFRPAFQYVNTLLEEGTFRRLQGLLYFTDGKGIYPKRRPAYDTAFIFNDEESAATAEVPSWAMKVVLGGSSEY